MKLVKLSLVAAMAAGLMASTASATPLDELIKNVDANGYARMRYQTNKADVGVKDPKSGKMTREKDHTGRWEFRGQLHLKTMIDDNFFAVVGGDYRYRTQGHGGYKNSKDELVGSTATSYGKHDSRLSNFHFGYNIAGTTVTVGRQALGTFFTDDMFGDGIKVVNTDIEGLTLAALFMDTLEADGDIATKDLFKDPTTGKKTGKETTDHNLYGVAAIGSYDPVSFQLWYAILEDVTDLFAVELTAGFDVADNINIGLKGQYAFSNMDSKFKTSLKNNVDDGEFWGIEASTKLFGLDFTAGYVDYSADKKDKLSLVSFEDIGSFINAGEQLVYSDGGDYTLFKGDNNYFFVTAMYEIPNTNFSFGADYLNGKNKFKEGVDNVEIKKQEIVGRFAYKATEQLKFSSYYSHYQEKFDGKKDKFDEFRFEAKYSF
ncbi:major outer membrane protein [Campylobacter blaseri]|uniref:Major outer membrane protein n=1 Tax=Campylobacter blaseri TaxID=2042961 RepID=A0A2P8R0P4_9BACT|nr:major outer membrane protein [Campylobacter blaseri]PSM52059.1 hypothetical protein CQ405_05735 [Campylobacter blaseri]PSM53844.1 hypothetical protein CRN67_05735 [Campylobacter blaseri]QKF85603.1 major outer membrane protein [Campylobacter blaseri]